MDLSPVLSVTVILSVDRQCYPTPGHTEVHSSGHDACVNTGKRSTEFRWINSGKLNKKCFKQYMLRGLVATRL